MKCMWCFAETHTPKGRKNFQNSCFFYSFYNDVVHDIHLYLTIQINVSRYFARDRKKQQNVYSCETLYNVETISPVE